MIKIKNVVSPDLNKRSLKTTPCVCVRHLKTSGITMWSFPAFGALADSQASRAGVVGTASWRGTYKGRDVQDEKAHLLRTPLFLRVSSFALFAVFAPYILLQRRHDITHRLRKFLEKFASCLMISSVNIVKVHLMFSLMDMTCNFTVVVEYQDSRYSGL